MLKKTITFEDYNGTMRTEDFYFHLNKAEIMEFNLATVGGLKEMLEVLVAKQDIPKIAVVFKELILKSYGEKSADGRRFIKSDELAKDFEQTEAYANLFMELLEGDNMAKFINAIIPADLAAEAIKAQQASLEAKN